MFYDERSIISEMFGLRAFGMKLKLFQKQMENVNLLFFFL
jgi:hypothetical protein